jgi:hypothetical protein
MCFKSQTRKTHNKRLFVGAISFLKQYPFSIKNNRAKRLFSQLFNSLIIIGLSINLGNGSKCLAQSTIDNRYLNLWVGLLDTFSSPVQKIYWTSIDTVLERPLLSIGVNEITYDRLGSIDSFCWSNLKMKVIYNSELGKQTEIEVLDKYPCECAPKKLSVKNRWNIPIEKTNNNKYAFLKPTGILLASVGIIWVLFYFRNQPSL